MAWTYTTLKQAMQDYLETDETTFVDNIDIIIQQAEDRILKKVQLPDFRKNVTGSTTTDDPYLSIPTDFLSPYSLSIDNSGQEFLQFKDVNFIREGYPTASGTGVPKYYAIFEDTFFLLGPTPDDDYTAELHYFYKPDSIVTASTSWLGTHAESALLWACLYEAYVFLKGDIDLLQVYKDRMDDAVNDLKILGEGRSKIDSYRMG